LISAVKNTLISAVVHDDNAPRAEDRPDVSKRVERWRVKVYITKTKAHGLLEGIPLHVGLNAHHMGTPVGFKRVSETS
jgi:hypothetical protein